MSEESLMPADSLESSLGDLEAQIISGELSQARRKGLEARLRTVLDNVGRLLDRLDPITQPNSVFDPSDPKIIGRFVALALVAQARHPLVDIPATYGAGVYAIYYRGEFPLYAPIRASETPIYVGQAAPSTNHARTPREQGDKLRSRLSTHRRNIIKANSTLSIDDFEFRSLVVQSGAETAAENYLIRLFNPIWNSETNILYGIGKHGDDAKTRANKRSPWDTIHPGRAWAAGSTQDAKTKPQIVAELDHHFAERRVFSSIDEVLASFIEELRQVS